MCALLAAAALGQPAGAQPSHALVLGYYVPYDPTSWASLEAHADQLDVVAAQWASIDACGGISAREDQTLKQFAHDHGIQVVPSLFTISAWLNHQLLADDDTRANALANIVSYTVEEGYDGFDLDLEGIDPADRAAYSDFVSALAAALHDQGKLLTLAVPAKERDATSGWAGAFDYAALGAQADLVTVMAYEYSGPFSGPGSVAPFDWVSRVTAFAAQKIPPERLLLGLAFYGYDWNATSGGAVSLGYPRALALATYFQVQPSLDGTQQSLTFGYTADAGDRGPRLAGSAVSAGPRHTITARGAAACDLVAPAAPTPTPAPPVAPNRPQVHEVWVEDASSVGARLGLAFNYRVRGVAAWRLGLEDPAVWSVVAEWRTADQGA